MCSASAQFCGAPSCSSWCRRRQRGRSQPRKRRRRIESGSSNYYSNIGSAVLQGTVEWAVYMPGQFPFMGYTPTGGEYVYAYQIFNAGSDDLSQLSVGGVSAPDNPGWFPDPGTTAPTAANVGAFSAVWTFGTSLSAVNGTSYGLAFSSPSPPTSGSFGSVIDSGNSATFSLGTPEPASIVIWALLGLACSAWGWQNAQRREVHTAMHILGALYSQHRRVQVLSEMHCRLARAQKPLGAVDKRPKSSRVGAR